MVAGWLLVLLAIEPSAGPAPQTAIATTVRVHLLANEELDSDHLRALARKNVTLWLSTRSNALRASTLETINRFSSAWIALHAPVGEADANQLRKVPTAGLWLDAEDLDGARRVLGPRKLAVKLSGPLDQPLADKLRQLRPAQLSWRAPAQIDLLSWGLFRQLPGRKLLFRGAAELWPVQCPEQPAPGEPAIEAAFETISPSTSDGFPCGRAPRVTVSLDVDRAALQALLVREPSTELVIDVGADSRTASKARKFLDELGLK